MKRAAQAPVAIALHYAGISILEESALSCLEGAFTNSSYGSMMCETLPIGMLSEVFSTALHGQMIDGLTTRFDHESADAPNSDRSTASTCGAPFSAQGSQHPSISGGPYWEQSGLKPSPWERSLLQTALLLRMSTLSSKEFIASGADESSAFINPKYVLQLQRGLMIGVDAAMAAGEAASKPVDLVLLMEWLEPLLYR